MDTEPAPKGNCGSRTAFLGNLLGISKMRVFSHMARRETGHVPAPLPLNSPKEKAHGFGYVL